MRAGPRPASPACPRCGYDLSGAVAAWKSQCPLDGVCPECGCPLSWPALCSPHPTRPAWSYEHARGPAWSLLEPCLLAAWRPDRLWRGLRMEHPVRPVRLAVFVLATTSAMYLTLVVFRCILDLHTVRMLAPSFDLHGMFATRESWRRRAFEVRNPWGSSYGRPWRAIGYWPALIVLIAPSTALLSVFAMRRRSLRPAHILRATAYAMPAAVALYLLCDAVHITQVLINNAFMPLHRSPSGVEFVRTMVWILGLPFSLFTHDPAYSVMAIAIGWSMWNLWSFARYYLHLPRAFAARMAAGGTALATLLACIAVTFMDPSRKPLGPIMLEVCARIWPDA